MGNCMETCTERPLEMGQKQEEEAGEFFKENGLEKSMRVKIVLTKEELEWLLFQLQINGGNGGLLIQDFLGDLEMRGRDNKAFAGWKPSLESITECPEVPETMVR